MREPKIIKRLCPLIWTPLVPDFKTPIWAQANNRFINNAPKGARIGHWPNLFVSYLYRIPLSKYPIWGANHFELLLFVTKINMMHDSPPKLNGFSKFPRARGSADALRHLSRSQKIHPEASRSQQHSSRKVERVPPVLRLGHPASRWGWIWLDVTFTLGTFHKLWPELNFKGYSYDLWPRLPPWSPAFPCLPMSSHHPARQAWSGCLSPTPVVEPSTQSNHQVLRRIALQTFWVTLVCKYPH